MSCKALAEAGFGTGAAANRLHLSDTSNGINFGDADAGVKIHLVDSPYMDVQWLKLDLTGRMPNPYKI